MLGVKLRSAKFKVHHNQAFPLSYLVYGEHGKKEGTSLVKFYEKYETSNSLTSWWIFNKLFWLKKDVSDFVPKLVFLGISSWRRISQIQQLNQMPLYPTWEDHMGWKYCPNWILFWEEYGNEVHSIQM